MLLNNYNNKDLDRLKEEADYLSIPGWRPFNGEDIDRVIFSVVDATRTIHEATSDKDIFFKYALYIPKQYARGEVKEYPSREELESGKMPRYELYVTDQVGSTYCRRNTYIYLKLPSGKMVAIILYPDYGVGFEPRDRKYILREYDQLDRRIILGFCRYCQSQLREACHGEADRKEWWLKMEARCYNSKKQPKRIKQGRESNFDAFYAKHVGLEPYDM